MSRLSRSQQQFQRPQFVSRSNGHGSDRSNSLEASRSNGHRCSVSTKETLHKGVSLPEIPTREGSPLGAAATPRSESRQAVEKPGQQNGSLLSAARDVFRQKVYSYDVQGRYSEVGTSAMGDEAYHKLLEAAKSPITSDGASLSDLPAPTKTTKEVPEGYKVGPATGLTIPDWWETELGNTPEEKLATIRRNLGKAKLLSKGNLLRTPDMAGRRWP
jgi:hypothetical protein